MSAPLLQAENLVRHFAVRGGLFGRGAQTVRAVDGVSLTVAAGETLGIVGESGCGKSTLGRLLLRLLEPTRGRVLLDGQDLGELGAAELRARRRAIQIIFQDPFSSLNPTMTVGGLLAEPLRLHGLVQGAEPIRARVGELLQTVGLSPDHAQRFPHEFSGGQRQRIGIARALAVEPKLIVCDEAVSALDVSVQAQVINLLMDLQRRYQLAYVFIAHDLAVVRQIADRVAVMYLGRVVEIADTDTLFERPLHPYTRALLAAVPRPVPRRATDAERVPRRLLDGDLPNPAAPPPGCHFGSRCPHVQPRCRSEAPTLVAAADLGLASAHASTEHRVACHFAAEILVQSGTTHAVAAPVTGDGADADSGADAFLARRLQRLQQAFVQSE